MSWPSAEIGNYVTKITTWNPAQATELSEFNYIDLSSVDKDAKEINLAEVPLISAHPKMGVFLLPA